MEHFLTAKLLIVCTTALVLVGCGGGGGEQGSTSQSQQTTTTTYTVTYNGNGAESGVVPVDTKAYASGQIARLPENTGGLQKSGFIFSGWNTDANQSGTTYSAGQTVLIGSSNITLYANWIAPPTFTVTYFDYGATGGQVPIDLGNYESGQTVVIQGNTGNLHKTGYSFGGWMFRNQTLLSGQTVSVESENLSLIPIWIGYFVNYNANGATAGYVPGDALPYQAGGIAVARENVGNLAKSGFEFVGWNTQSDGSGTTFAENQPITMEANNLTLYAQWVALPSLLVDIESQAVVTHLDAGPRTMVMNPNVQFELTSSGGNSYGLHLIGGSLPNQHFMTNLNLVELTSSLVSTRREVAGFSVNEHLAYVNTFTGEARLAVAVQTLPRSGIYYAGMANWKYDGPYQTGYFTGNSKIASGSLVFGQTTSPSIVDLVPSTTYSGYAQTGGSLYLYKEEFPQLVANASVVLDRTAGTATVSLTNMKFWGHDNWIGYDMMPSIDSFMSGQTRELTNLKSLSCVTSIVPANNMFSCDVTEPPMTYGRIIGRFFGPGGEEVAGTFALYGDVWSDWILSQSLTGAFVTKR